MSLCNAYMYLRVCACGMCLMCTAYIHTYIQTYMCLHLQEYFPQPCADTKSSAAGPAQCKSGRHAFVLGAVMHTTATFCPMRKRGLSFPISTLQKAAEVVSAMRQGHSLAYVDRLGCQVCLHGSKPSS